MKKCIYIATHIPFIPPKSKLYKPIQVGSMIYPNLPYLKKNFIILPKPLDFGAYTVKEQYALCHHYQDYEISEKIVQKLYPKYQDDFTSISNQKQLYCWNMFIMHWDLLKDYCNWLFPILETLEELLNTNNMIAIISVYLVF